MNDPVQGNEGAMQEECSSFFEPRRDALSLTYCAKSSGHLLAQRIARARSPKPPITETVPAPEVPRRSQGAVQRRLSADRQVDLGLWNTTSLAHPAYLHD